MCCFGLPTRKVSSCRDVETGRELRWEISLRDGLSWITYVRFKYVSALHFATIKATNKQSPLLFMEVVFQLHRGFSHAAAPRVHPTHRFSECAPNLLQMGKRRLER